MVKIVLVLMVTYSYVKLFILFYCLISRLRLEANMSQVMISC